MNAPTGRLLVCVCGCGCVAVSVWLCLCVCGCVAVWLWLRVVSLTDTVRRFSFRHSSSPSCLRSCVPCWFCWASISGSWGTALCSRCTCFRCMPCLPRLAQCAPPASCVAHPSLYLSYGVFLVGHVVARLIPVGHSVRPRGKLSARRGKSRYDVNTGKGTSGTGNGNGGGDDDDSVLSLPSRRRRHNRRKHTRRGRSHSASRARHGGETGTAAQPVDQGVIVADVAVPRTPSPHTPSDEARGGTDSQRACSPTGAVVGDDTEVDPSAVSLQPVGATTSTAADTTVPANGHADDVNVAAPSPSQEPTAANGEAVAASNGVHAPTAGATPQGVVDAATGVTQNTELDGGSVPAPGPAVGAGRGSCAVCRAEVMRGCGWESGWRAYTHTPQFVLAVLCTFFAIDTVIAWKVRSASLPLPQVHIVDATYAQYVGRRWCRGCSNARFGRVSHTFAVHHCGLPGTWWVWRQCSPWRCRFLCLRSCGSISRYNSSTWSPTCLR